MLVLDTGSSLSAVPALPPAPNCLKLVIHHTVGTDVNTGYHYFFRGDKPATAAQLGALVNAVNAAWITNMAPLTATDTSLTNVIATDLSDPSGATNFNNGIVAGTRSGGFLPASSSVLYNMQISRRYRGGKPRIYIPCGVQPDLGNAQTWATVFTNLVNTAQNNMVTAIQNSMNTWSAVHDLVNISYYHSILVSTPPAPPVYQQVLREAPVIDVVVARASSSVVGTQRRRLRPG